MNVVSFSVFGSAPIYCYGAVRNATEYPRVLGQDWKVVMWCDESVPRDIQLKLRQAGADVRTPPQPIANGMFWRFVILDDPKVEHALFRDTDSRPIQREALAIKAWMQSSKPFHVMADHPHHTLPMGGGLWGIDKTKIKGDMPHILCHMEDAIIRSRLAARTYTREKGYSLDQTFLTKHIWPLAKQYGIMRHDSCNRHLFRESVPFPSGCRMGDERFVGEVVTADDKPHPIHYQMRYNYMMA